MRTSLEKKVRDDRLKFVRHPTKVLLENVIKKQIKNSISKFICSDKKVTEEVKVISEDINNYYRELLGKEKVSEESITNYDFKIKKMNDTAMSPSLDEKISYNEAYKVIMDMEDSARAVMVLQ